MDQANTVFNTAITNGFEAALSGGQSFTPTFSQIDSAEFYANINSTTDTFVLDLFTSANFATGTLLATSGQITIVSTVTNGAFQPMNFLFATPITLVPGNIYSLRVRLTSYTSVGNGTYTLECSTGNAYTGGNFVNYAGGSTAGLAAYDLTFKEALSTVPEPSTWALLLAGSIVVCGLARRQRRLS